MEKGSFMNNHYGQSFLNKSTKNGPPLFSIFIRSRNEFREMRVRIEQTRCRAACGEQSFVLEFLFLFFQEKRKYTALLFQEKRTTHSF